MMRRIFSAALIFSVSLVAGCSLFKVDVSTPAALPEISAPAPAPAPPAEHCAHFAFARPRPKPSLPSVISIACGSYAACLDDDKYRNLAEKIRVLEADDNYLRNFYTGQLKAYDAADKPAAK